MHIEARDLEILKCCMRGPRSPYELSKMLSMPTSSVYRRVKRLKEAGFLTGDLRPTVKACVTMKNLIDENEYYSCLMRAWNVELELDEFKRILSICKKIDPWECLLELRRWAQKELIKTVYTGEPPREVISLVKLLGFLVPLICRGMKLLGTDALAAIYPLSLKEGRDGLREVDCEDDGNSDRRGRRRARRARG